MWIINTIYDTNNDYSRLLYNLLLLFNENYRYAENGMKQKIIGRS